MIQPEEGVVGTHAQQVRQKHRGQPGLARGTGRGGGGRAVSGLCALQLASELN